jgi:hypothetical protein
MRPSLSLAVLSTALTCLTSAATIPRAAEVEKREPDVSMATPVPPRTHWKRFPEPTPAPEAKKWDDEFDDPQHTIKFPHRPPPIKSKRTEDDLADQADILMMEPIPPRTHWKKAPMPTGTADKREAGQFDHLYEDIPPRTNMKRVEAEATAIADSIRSLPTPAAEDIEARGCNPDIQWDPENPVDSYCELPPRTHWHRGIMATPVAVAEKREPEDEGAALDRRGGGGKTKWYSNASETPVPDTDAM